MCKVILQVLFVYLMFLHLSIAKILRELVPVQIAYFLNATYLSINDHTFCRGLLHTLRNGVLSAKSFYNVVCKLQIYIRYIYIYISDMCFFQYL